MAAAEEIGIEAENKAMYNSVDCQDTVSLKTSIVDSLPLIF